MLHTVVKAILNKWFFAFYFVLAALYFTLTALSLPGCSLSYLFFSTLGLLTGSDPYSFSQAIESNPYVWGLAWLIHVVSWLFIPALAGLIITDIAEDIKNDRELDIGLTYLAASAGIPQSEIPDFLATVKADIKSWSSTPKNEDES